MDASTLKLMPLGTLSPAVAPGPATTKDSPEAIAKAAAQFEALLIANVLKSARESDGDDGWLGGGQDSDSGLSSLAEQQLAQNLAASGGLGLSRLITAGLTRSSSGPVNAVSTPE
jgi:Rod binding domain-containing protein